MVDLNDGRRVELRCEKSAMDRIGCRVSTLISLWFGSRDVLTS